MNKKNAFQKRFSFGNHEIFPNVFPAPMSGVTDAPFRRLLKELSGERLGLLVSEFVSVEAIANNRKREMQGMDFGDYERPICIQIFGGDVENMALGAEAVERAGADFVEVNVGCPVPKVVKKGGGSALLKDLSRLEAILKAIRPRVSIPLSIKVRLGWDPENVNVFETLKIAENEGVELFSVHGRTRVQGYQGLADWDIIGEVKQRASIPVIGNGDVRTVSEIESRLATYGVDGVSIGRGIMHNPWIFKQIADKWSGQEVVMPDAQEQLFFFKRYTELLEERQFEPSRQLGRLKQLVARWANTVQASQEWRQLFLRSGSLAEFFQNLDRWFHQFPEAPFYPEELLNLNGEDQRSIKSGCDY